VTTSTAKVVLGGCFLAKYPEGGGVWAGIFQYLFALELLGHDVFWLEVLRATGESDADRVRIRRFFEEFDRHGFGDRCALLVVPPGTESRLPPADHAFGRTLEDIKGIARSSDILWNFAGSLDPPLLELFKRRAYIDGDPGIIQIAALTQPLNIELHEVLFTVGANMHAADCEVPTLGRSWHTFLPGVELSRWTVEPAAGPDAAFSSITQWNWGEYHHEGRVLSTSKRDAYLRYVELPRAARRSFELAASIDATDAGGDRPILEANGWRLVDPHIVAGTVEDYVRYIASSRAELSCPKPIYRELRSGWFSDRSACYLAAGRPVLAEETGISGVVPTGSGFVTFTDVESAVAGVQAIDSDYENHSAAARAFAEQFLDARKNVTRMLERSLQP
jgi:hypothetical protein